MPPSASVLERYVAASKKHDYELGRLRAMREQEAKARREADESERKIGIIHSVGQQVGEVLQVVDENNIIVRTSLGPRYLVNKRPAIPASQLSPGTRVALALNTNTIMHVLPVATDPQVFKMAEMADVVSGGQDKVDYDDIGGLKKELQLIKEIVELPLQNPELFKKVGIKAPKSVLLFGPPGVGKSLICRCLANSLSINFLKIVGSQIVSKYIGESAKTIRDMFQYARLHQPCLLMIDEVDSIAGKRGGGSSASDREVGRCLLQLLTEMDGFTELDEGVKIIMCTNRPDFLDEALLRPGRCDVKIEIRLPDSVGRYEILKIHSRNINMGSDCDFASVVKASEGFNGADLRNVITEAGLNAIRGGREMVLQEDLLHGTRVVRKNKALEASTHRYGMKGFNDD